jgi:hypothetical protein
VTDDEDRIGDDDNVADTSSCSMDCENADEATEPPEPGFPAGSVTIEVAGTISNVSTEKLGSYFWEDFPSSVCQVCGGDSDYDKGPPSEQRRRDPAVPSSAPLLLIRWTCPISISLSIMII